MNDKSAIVFHFCALIFSGFAAGQLCVLIFNIVPAKWLCDYGETPGANLGGKRVYAKKHGLPLGAVLTAAFTLLYLQYFSTPPLFLIYCAVSVALVFLSLSDIKYQIIPEQSVIALTLLGIGNYIYNLSAGVPDFNKTNPLIGALCGGGLWVLLGIVGKILYHKESVGFGDVKLFAAVGFLAGFPLVIIIFFLTILTAAAHFSVLLLAKKIDAEKYMPMAPYICAVTIAAFAFKSQIAEFIKWYFSFMHGTAI